MVHVRVDLVCSGANAERAAPPVHGCHRPGPGLICLSVPLSRLEEWLLLLYTAAIAPVPVRDPVLTPRRSLCRR